MPLPPRDFTKIEPNEGVRFPDIRLPDQQGGTVDLHAMRGGRKAIVVFHRSADWVWPSLQAGSVVLFAIDILSIWVPASSRDAGDCVSGWENIAAKRLGAFRP